MWPQLQRLLGTILFVVLGARSYWHDRKRAEALREVAPTLRLSFERAAKDLDPLVVGLVRRWSRRGAISNAMKGREEAVEVVVLDQGWSFDSPWRPPQTLAAFRSKAWNLPPFSLRPETHLDRLAARLGMQDIDFGKHPGFSANYRLRGDDEPSVRALFGPRLLDYFEKESCWAVEGLGRWLLVYRPDVLQPPERLGLFLDETRAVASLFRSVHEAAGS